MFKKFVKAMLAAKTSEEVTAILYNEQGVDMMFQREKLRWDEHEMLFDLAARLMDGMDK